MSKAEDQRKGDDQKKAGEKVEGKPADAADKKSTDKAHDKADARDGDKKGGEKAEGKPTDAASRDSDKKGGDKSHEKSGDKDKKADVPRADEKKPVDH